MHLAIRATEPDPSGWAQISHVSIDVSCAEHPAALNWDAFETGMMSLNPVPRIHIGIGQHDIMLHYMLQGGMLSRLIESEKLIIHETILGKGVTIEELRSQRDRPWLSPTEVFYLLMADRFAAHLNYLHFEHARDQASLLAPLSTSPKISLAAPNDDGKSAAQDVLI